MHSYIIDIAWNDILGMFVATVPDLPFCSVVAASHEEAFDLAEKAVKLWVMAAERNGYTVPKPTLQIVMDDYE